MNFLFSPRLTGKFHELITIQNCHDPTQSHEIVLKAEVRVIGYSALEIGGRTATLGMRE